MATRTARIVGGVGYVRYDVPVEHPKFGKLETCVCRAKDVAEAARSRLFAMSNLNRLSHLTFENFSPAGNDRAKFMSAQERENLRVAFEKSEDFARKHEGWLLLEGGYGCGKTHLAAAIANFSVNNGMPTLFITVPDLLDSLRFSYDDPEITFEQRFDDIRNSGLLILDDFGTQNATPWAQEKLFQIINYRYINKLPTVITTNLMLDEIEARIRSRLQDESFVNHLKISAPDYRRPEETSNPGISMLALPEMKVMTFKTFQPRDDEVGTEAVTTTTIEKNDRFGNKVKDKEISRITISKDDVKTLHEAHNAAVEFAEKPEGWLVLLGQSFSGKTHLAAAVGNYRIGLGGQALLVEVTALLDYLRQTFGRNSDVSFDRRFHEIRTTPLLILDDLKESGAGSVWAEDKLYSVLNYRYNAHLPTVITSTLRPEAFALSYPNLWNKLLDPTKCQVVAINMPPYRRVVKGGKPAAKKK
ncbi:MAG: ATP-binding protein [Anaerolineales bacterium]|uniref:ATP-binding protein n=1 Tax=Candidatus Villigracilis vicinus TaxID=3140679 RepID=UPI0031351723|nr:ATP-binding protein [Anaerolineales bacterium]